MKFNSHAIRAFSDESYFFIDCSDPSLSSLFPGGWVNDLAIFGSHQNGKITEIAIAENRSHRSIILGRPQDGVSKRVTVREANTNLACVCREKGLKIVSVEEFLVLPSINNNQWEHTGNMYLRSVVLLLKNAK